MGPDEKRQRRLLRLAPHATHRPDVRSGPGQPAPSAHFVDLFYVHQRPLQDRSGASRVLVSCSKRGSMGVCGESYTHVGGRRM